MANLMEIPVGFITKHEPVNQWRIYYVFIRLMRALGRDRARASVFLQQAHPSLENKTPVELIEAGELGALERMVEIMNGPKPG